MKKLIIFLIVVQITILSVYTLFLLRGYTVDALINENTATIMLVFDTPEEYQFFLDLAEREGLTITRPIYVDDENLMVHTSDLSLGGRVELKSGRWPYETSNEFVSVIDTGESSQVGFIHNIAPRFNLSITRIENTTNMELHGIYFVSNTNQNFLEDFVYELDNNIYRAEMFSITNEVSILNQITAAQIIELGIISFLLFLCILATFLNYSVNKLKLGVILIIHGYKKFSLLKKIIFELLCLLLFALIISYTLLLAYIFLAGYTPFLNQVSLYFLLICSFLFLFYLVVSVAFMTMYSLPIRATNILKGRKPYFILQLFNYGLKIIFLVAIFIFGIIAIDNFTELNYRLEATSSWELAENIHATRVYSVGQATDLSIDLEIMTRKLELYSSLSREHNAFIMDSRNIRFLDAGIMPYSDMSLAPPMELSPHGNSVLISPNFIEYNPIVAVNGLPILEQIVYDSYILNILVPEKLLPYENEIFRLFLDYFYFSSVGIDNIYNSDLGFELNTTPIESLSLNIIYVEDNQYYFSFDHRTRPEFGNNINDPIAILYTGSLHPSVLSSSMGENFFFHTDSIDAHNSILPLLLESELSHVIMSTVSVFDQNAREILEIRDYFLRLTALSIVLIISSFTIVYSLMENYIEKNKLRIFIKSIMGYNFINRHLKFLLTILLCNGVIMIVFGTLSGVRAVILGAVLLLLDISFILLIDKRLTQGSFSKIIKGEH